MHVKGWDFKAKINKNEPHIRKHTEYKMHVKGWAFRVKIKKDEPYIRYCNNNMLSSKYLVQNACKRLGF
jgi:hypothetical protein